MNAERDVVQSCFFLVLKYYLTKQVSRTLLGTGRGVRTGGFLGPIFQGNGWVQQLKITRPDFKSFVDCCVHEMGPLGCTDAPGQGTHPGQPFLRGITECWEKPADLHSPQSLPRPTTGPWAVNSSCRTISASLMGKILTPSHRIFTCLEEWLVHGQVLHVLSPSLLLLSICDPLGDTFYRLLQNLTHCLVYMLPIFMLTHRCALIPGLPDSQEKSRS